MLLWKDCKLTYEMKRNLLALSGKPLKITKIHEATKVSWETVDVTIKLLIAMKLVEKIQDKT